MTPNLQLHRSVNSRLRRLSPPGELSRWAAREAPSLSDGLDFCRGNNQGEEEHMISVRALNLIIVVASLSLPSAVVRAQDPVTATPEIYKVLHENDSVRILELTYQPGQSENWHSHPRYFVYVVEAGKLQVENENGELREVDLKPGQNVLTGPITKHRVKNLSDHTVRLLSIELKRE